MAVTVRRTRAHLRRRSDEEQRAAEARLHDLEDALPVAVAILRELGAERVWCFGSLAAGDVHAGSDLDLAVCGLSPSTWVEASGRLSRQVPVTVELVRLEDAPPTLRDRILDEGIAQ